MTKCSSFDRAYFTARLDRNRALADRSSNPVIRDIHLEYVRLYEGLLDAGVPASPYLAATPSGRTTADQLLPGTR